MNLSALSDTELLSLYKETENNIASFDAAQWSQKIKINSVYGAVANEWFRYFSHDNASAITTSGQMAAKMIAQRVNVRMNKICKTTDVDYVIASDTDSIYLNCEGVVNQLPSTTSKEEIVNFLDTFCKKVIEPFIAKCFQEHAESLNAYKSALHMKRESIAERAVWRAKKNYIMYVWDIEGLRYAKPIIKTSGVESVRSTTPKVCRKALEEAYEILMSGDENDMINFIDSFKNKFYEMPFEDIAKPSGINGIDKWSDKKTIYRKGTPYHVKAAIVYNNMIIKKKLTKKYPVISNKDKIRTCVLKTPNPAFSPVIAVPKELPKELGLAKYIDYNAQFEKTFLSPITSFLDIVGWSSKRRNTLDQFC